MNERKAPSGIKPTARKRLRTTAIVGAVATVLSAILTASTGINIPVEIIDAVISNFSTGGA